MMRRARTDPFLETPRLFLRCFTPDDAPLLYDLDSDPEVMRYISQGQPTPLATIEEEVLPRWLAWYKKGQNMGYWAAHEQASGDFIGWFHFRPARYTPDAMELGYRLKRNVWGRGYATEGSTALLHKAFTEWEVAYVVATTLEANKASQRVMEKCGLRRERFFTYPESRLPGWTADERRGVQYGLTQEAYLSRPT